MKNGTVVVVKERTRLQTILNGAEYFPGKSIVKPEFTGKIEAAFDDGDGGIVYEVKENNTPHGEGYHEVTPAEIQ